MKYLVLSAIALLLLLSSCTQKSSDSDIQFQAELQNVQDLDTLNIYGFLFENKVGFKDSLYQSTHKFENTGYYILDMGEEYMYFYYDTQDPNSELTLKADFSDFKNTAKVSGNSEKENQYLLQKKWGVDTLMSNQQAFYSQNEGDFMKSLSQFKTQALKILQQSDVSTAFQKIEAQNIEYETQMFLVNYPDYHPHFTKDENFQLSDSLQAKIDAINTDNNEDVVVYRFYRNIVMSRYNNVLYKDYKDGDDVGLKAIQYVDAQKSPNIKNFLLDSFRYLISPSAKSNTQVYDEVMRVSTNENTKEEITKVYEGVQKLEKGKPSPQFSYENYFGGTTTLADLKGKYVYIDVWATWCGPCKQEIPSLKKVEEEFHENNIAFVSISVDDPKDKKTWKDMVESKQLKGIQLFSDNAWKSSFIEEYRIQGIPRFILIDPDGNIVDADAKRPSNPELEIQLKALPGI